MADTILGNEQQYWRDLANLWASQFPDIHTLAREEAVRIIKRYSGRDLDPEQVWWHRFDGAVSSARSFTGWQHCGRPVQSMTFLQLLLQRYAARDQDSLDNLQVEGGFYTDDAGHGVYDERNEVRLLATQVSSEFWKVDFAQGYKKRLARFWYEQGENFVQLAKITLRAAIVAARQRKELALADLKGLQSLYEGRPTQKVYRLTLGPYTARDVLRMVGTNGRQLLYLPGDSHAVKVFASVDDLYTWLRETASQDASRDTLLGHFSSFNIAHTQELAGLAKLLEEVRNDPHGTHLNLLDLKGPAIAGDPCLWLRKSAQREMLMQADALLLTNAHLREQLWLGYLGTFINLGSAFAPLGWPIALLVVGASAISLALNVHKALTATTSTERREGIRGAILSVVTLVFNVPLVFDGGLAVELPFEDTPVLADLPVNQADELIPLLPVPGLPAGARLNTIGLLERSDFKVLYRVDPLPRGTNPASVLEPLRPTTRFPDAKAMLDGPLLRTYATPAGALQYAKSEFDGPFVMHEIDAHGLRAASFRENAAHNHAALISHAGLAMEELASGAWLFDEVHLSLDGVTATDFLPVGADELGRLQDGLQTTEALPTSAQMLQGVRCSSPVFGRYRPYYSIEVDEVTHEVRYDPLTDTWRTDAGSAWRFDTPHQRFEAIPIPGGGPLRLAAAIDRSVGLLGIDARWPWQLEPLSSAGALPLPRKIHSIWLGRHVPRTFIKRVLHNAEEAGQGTRPFEMHLYLDIKDPVELDTTLLRLAGKPSSLKIHTLENTPFFQALRETPYYAQYKAASSGSALNYASAVDILRYRLLSAEGGLYMDVDDLIEGGQDGLRSFADHDFLVPPGHLLLNNLVFHRRLQMFMDFNTSNFASLANNPLLDRISEQSYQRFLANRGLYESRPFDFKNTATEMDAYGRQISYTTGPRLFNDILAEALPAYRQFRALHRIARGELYVAPALRTAIAEQLSDCFEDYCALGGLIRIGSTGSWLYT